MSTINLPNLSATINNLTCLGTLTQSGRPYLSQYANGNQAYPTGNTIFQLPNVVTQQNLAGNISVDANNQTFTNISGGTKTWLIMFESNMSNNDAATYRFATKVLYNGGTFATGISYYIPANSQTGENSACCMLQMSNNDYVQIQGGNTATVAGTLNNLMLQIMVM